MTEYIVVPKGEYSLIKGKSALKTGDVEEILEYRDVFITFLNTAIDSLRADLANLKLVGKEAQAYIEIGAIEKLKKDLTTLETTYKKHIDNEKKDK